MMLKERKVLTFFRIIDYIMKSSGVNISIHLEVNDQMVGYMGTQKAIRRLRTPFFLQCMLGSKMSQVC